MGSTSQLLSSRATNVPLGSAAVASTVSKRRVDSALATTRSNNNTNNLNQQNQLFSFFQKVPKMQRNTELGLETQTEDSLEYFIKFPSPKFDNELEPVTDTAIYLAHNEINVPIVLLLGWAGCQHRYLMKYSKIYEDRGLITVRYTAPVDTLFWRRSSMVPIGEKILKLIYDMNLDTHPVIFHIFSNGGAYLYQHIALAIRRHNTPLKIKGVIFDSAPGERRVLGLYRAVTAIYGKDKRKCNCISALAITMTLSIMWFIEETFVAFKSLFIKSKTPRQTNPFTDLKNEPNKYPQMFLYSKGDAVIPYQDIEKFIRIRQSHGVCVSSVCFEDAEHVKIFTKYPHQYIQCVCTFINKCLSLPTINDAGDGSYSSTSNSTADLIASHPNKFE